MFSIVLSAPLKWVNSELTILQGEGRGYGDGKGTYTQDTAVQPAVHRVS